MVYSVSELSFTVASFVANGYLEYPKERVIGYISYFYYTLLVSTFSNLYALPYDGKWGNTVCPSVVL